MVTSLNIKVVSSCEALKGKLDGNFLFVLLFPVCLLKHYETQIQRNIGNTVPVGCSRQSRFIVGSFVVLKATFSLSTFPVISAVSLKYNSVPLMTYNLRCVGGRRGCSFSHDLSSDHNVRMLMEHGLESLSRTELCTLLLQSDERLLPSVSMATCGLQECCTLNIMVKIPNTATVPWFSTGLVSE